MRLDDSGHISTFLSWVESIYNSEVAKTCRLRIENMDVAIRGAEEFNPHELAWEGYCATYQSDFDSARRVMDAPFNAPRAGNVLDYDRIEFPE